MKRLALTYAMWLAAVGVATPVASAEQAASEPSAIERLIRQEDARSNDPRLGLAVKPNGQALGRSGAPTPGLFALGPLGQGSLWEITAVPEIVRQCDQAAQSIASLAAAQEHEAELSAAVR